MFVFGPFTGNLLFNATRKQNYIYMCVKCVADRCNGNISCFALPVDVVLLLRDEAAGPFEWAAASSRRFYDWTSHDDLSS